MGCHVETGNSHKVSLQNLESGDAKAGILEDNISKRKEKHRENSRDLQGLLLKMEQSSNKQSVSQIIKARERTRRDP